MIDGMTTIEIKPGSGGVSPQGAIAMKKLLAFYTLWASAPALGMEIDDLGAVASDSSYNYISFKIDDYAMLAKEAGLHRFVFVDGKLRYTVFLRVIVNGKQTNDLIRSYVYDPYQLFKNLSTDHSAKELTQESTSMLVAENLSRAKAVTL